jgi:glycine/sarcosine N-methyltransferase
MIRNQYNNISVLYDLLSEGDDGMLYFRLYVEERMKDLPKGAGILDCSCGTGNHAIWFSRKGYNVHASDISEGMIDCSKKKAEKEGVDIKFFRSSWEELPDNTNEHFDLVVCPGNSLSHVLSMEMLQGSLNAIRKIVKPGGSLFFDLRNWEKTFEENNIPDQDFQVKGKEGVFDVRYSYKINGWNTPCQMFVDVRPAEEEEYTHYAFDFFPFGFYQLYDALLEAGFENVERGFFPSEEYYFVVAK